MRKRLSYRLLSRYLSGTATEKERARVESWIQANPGNRRDFDQILKLWEVSGRSDDEGWGYAGQLEKYRVKIREDKNAQRRGEQVRLYRIPQRQRANVFSTRVISSIAAAVIVLFGVIYVAQYLKREALEEAARTRLHDLVIEEASTKPGEQVSLRFANGTKAILNSASTLKYSVNGDGVQNIYLKGEAYFMVVHSDAHPFVVHTNDGIIRDIGTEFDVKAWPNDRNMRVVVMKGIVSVQSFGKPAKPVVLTAHQYSLIDPDSILIPPTYTPDPAKFIAWLNGNYAFHNALVSEVLRQIWRTYGIHCFVSDSSVLQKRITTSFSAHDPAKKVIDVLALALQLQCTTHRDSVFFARPKLPLRRDAKGAERKSSSVYEGQVNE